MSRLPVVSANELEKLLIKLGFKIIRQKGSHRFYKHPDGRYTTLPHHPGEDILRQIELDVDDYIRLLNEK